MPPRIGARELAAIILVQVCALFVHAWLKQALMQRGTAEPLAHDIAYLVVPPLALGLLAPVLWQQRTRLRRLFCADRLSVSLVLTAIAIGALLRLAWWSQLVARVAFGFAPVAAARDCNAPTFVLACPSPPALGLGILVMATLIPLLEETMDRGLIQSAFASCGPVRAIVLSALVFTAFHAPAGYATVFLAGLVLGTQCWRTRSLWPGIVTHATYNAAMLLDWRCLHGRWNPCTAQLPALVPGAAAGLVLVAALLLILLLLARSNAGVPCTPATRATSVHSQRAR